MVHTHIHQMLEFQHHYLAALKQIAVFTLLRCSTEEWQVPQAKP